MPIDSAAFTRWVPSRTFRVPGLLRSPSFLAAAALGSLGTPATSQAATKLNPPFEYEGVVGDVRDFLVKRNGNVVFFRADDRRAGVVELLTVPALGGVAPFRENGYLRADRSVVAYEPGPVGPWIVFLSDQRTDDVFELFSRRSGDTAPRRLSGVLAAGGDVDSFAISSDGTRVVYRADQDADEVFELYSVPIDASASPVKISGTLVAGGDVSGNGIHEQFLGLFEMFREYLVTTGRVVYLADRDTDGVNELYSVPIDGSASPVELNAPLAPGGDVRWPFSVTADGATVVYRADQGADELLELFRAPIDGSASPTQIHPPLAPGGIVTGFELSADGERVVYSAGQDTFNLLEVYSAPLDGSVPPVKLNTPGQASTVAAISPDSAWVVLKQNGLRSVPLDGSASPILLESEPFGNLHVTFSPDSSRLVYRTGFSPYQGVTEWTSLRSVPIDGTGSPVRLDDEGSNEISANFQPLTPFAISADSTRVVYTWTDSSGNRGLYSVPIDRSAAPVALATGDVGPLFTVSPLGSRAFFTLDVTGTDTFELHSVSLLNGAGLVKLSAELARDTFADVDSPDYFSTQDFRIDSQAERVVYSADPSTDEEFQLFSVPANGGGPLHSLTGSGVVTFFEIGPDDERVVFRSHPPALYVDELYSVPLDGGETPVKLNGALGTNEHVGAFQLSADGARALYTVHRAVQFAPPPKLFSAPIAGGVSPILLANDATSVTLGSGQRVVYVRGNGNNLPADDQLFSRPIDGSSPAIELDAGLGGYQSYLQVTPDGNRAVFMTRFYPDHAFYSVPADGSASPVRLSGTTLPSSAPKVSPDGIWFVFGSREAATSAVTELFCARIDGTLGPVKLNGPLVSGGAVFASQISPDSGRVVYAADQDVDEVIELYSVPIDGSASPVKLNGALVSGGDVFTDFRITPDGARVVYVADQGADEVRELFSVPIDGSASPVRLSGSMVSGGDERAFQISPDSRLVVYAADQEVDELAELFLAPIDGSLEPLKLNWPVAKAGHQSTSEPLLDGVGAFEITPDSRRVVFEATERTQVTELFSSVLTFDSKRRHVRRP